MGQFWKIAGNVASAVLGLGQAGAGLGTQIDQNRKQREHEAKMAEYAYNKDLEMWNRANEYNTPQAQMERFKEAGLNPNMIYGSKTGVTGNTVATMPKYTPPRQDYNVQFPNIAGNIQAYQSLDLKQAQIDNLKAQTDLRIQQRAINRIQETYAGFMSGDKVIEDNYGNDWTWKQLLEVDEDKLRKVRGIAPSIMKGVWEIRRELYSTKTAEYNNKVARWKAWLSDHGLTPSDDTITRLLYNMYKDDPKTAETISLVMYSARELTDIIGKVGRLGLLGKAPKVRGTNVNKEGRKAAAYQSGKWKQESPASRIDAWNAQRGYGR